MLVIVGSLMYLIEVEKMDLQLFHVQFIGQLLL